MTEWILFLPPLLVLPIVLLFRFVGCGEQLALAQSDPLPTPQPTPAPTPTPTPTPPPDTEKREAPPRYRDYILGSGYQGRCRQQEHRAERRGRHGLLAADR